MLAINNILYVNKDLGKYLQKRNINTVKGRVKRNKYRIPVQDTMTSLTLPNKFSPYIKTRDYGHYVPFLHTIFKMLEVTKSSQKF